MVRSCFEQTLDKKTGPPMHPQAGCRGYQRPQRGPRQAEGDGGASCRQQQQRQGPQEKMSSVRPAWVESYCICHRVLVCFIGIRSCLDCDWIFVDGLTIRDF